MAPSRCVRRSDSSHALERLGRHRLVGSKDEPEGKSVSAAPRWRWQSTTSTSTSPMTSSGSTMACTIGLITCIWGIHLTGVARPRCSPRAVRWTPHQTRRVPARPRRRWRDSPRSTVGYEVLVAHRVVGDGELKHPKEHHPPAPGAPTVEAKHELVEVAGQVRPFR